MCKREGQSRRFHAANQGQKSRIAGTNAEAAATCFSIAAAVGLAMLNTNSVCQFGR
jgi:hypothetical protein